MSMNAAINGNEVRTITKASREGEQQLRIGGKVKGIFEKTSHDPDLPPYIILIINIINRSIKIYH